MPRQGSGESFFDDESTEVDSPHFQKLQGNRQLERRSNLEDFYVSKIWSLEGLQQNFEEIPRKSKKTHWEPKRFLLFDCQDDNLEKEEWYAVSILPDFSHTKRYRMIRLWHKRRNTRKKIGCRRQRLLLGVVEPLRTRFWKLEPFSEYFLIVTFWFVYVVIISVFQIRAFYFREYRVGMFKLRENERAWHERNNIH